ncbi:MAG: DUF1934 domain-containing protein [Oscillospiraceae bacterium]|nr:DUF1934 domain-containing protein [Oscillospiraceae bacterium]MDD4546852.1 DUF1934 domain-containing protein [Oscillospiraceae bacterium]
MKVWISIKGIQHSQGESNELELSTTGQMERTGDGYKLTYQESETTGMEGVTTSLFINPTAITLERKGAMNTIMLLEKGRRTVCNYDTGFGSMMMGIYAKDIRTNLADGGGDFDFHYTMDINSGLASAHDVYVSVRKTPDQSIKVPVKRQKRNSNLDN